MPIAKIPAVFISVVGDSSNRPRTCPAERRPAAEELWQGENNRYERAALEALGLRFDLCKSTEEAEHLLVQPDLYSVIVSDMSRPPDGTAGLTLLDLLRDRQIRTPCIIYAGTATPQQIAETKGRGGMGQTNDPNELVEMVATALSLPAQP